MSPRNSNAGERWGFAFQRAVISAKEPKDGFEAAAAVVQIPGSSSTPRAAPSTGVGNDANGRARSSARPPAMVQPVALGELRR